jgi:hypothetical protein
MRNTIEKLPAYPAGHPVAIALAALGHAITGGTDVVRALDEHARAAGVAPGSEPYDEAAELAGFPYCRALDLYLPRATRDRADSLHFSEAHLALVD